MPIKTKNSTGNIDENKSIRKVQLDPKKQVDNSKKLAVSKICTCNHVNYYRSDSGRSYPICDGKCDWS